MGLEMTEEVMCPWVVSTSAVKRRYAILSHLASLEILLSTVEPLFLPSFFFSRRILKSSNLYVKRTLNYEVSFQMVGCELTLPLLCCALVRVSCWVLSCDQHRCCPESSRCVESRLHGPTSQWSLHAWYPHPSTVTERNWNNHCYYCTGIQAEYLTSTVG